MSLAPQVVAQIPAYEIVGPPDAPAIAVLGGISATRHVCANPDDATPGWWEMLAGSDRALDTTRWRLFGCDFLDGGCGDDGRPERLVTTRDQADGIAAALDDAGIERLHAFIGASYGGMVALAFAERHPERLERVVAIGAAHASHPMITALRTIQRRIVELGLETGRAHDALVLARALAMTTYRTAAEFDQRFGITPDEVTSNDATFPVEGYLRHHGERFASRWTPARFLALSLSSDLHAVDPACIRVPTFLIAEEGDSIAPRVQLETLAREIAAPCVLLDLPTTHGHDAFLTEPHALGPLLSTALTSRIPAFT